MADGIQNAGSSGRGQITDRSSSQNGHRVRLSLQSQSTNALGQPANATTVLCLAFNAASTRWYSRPCTDAKPYICKVPALSNEPDTGEPSPAVCPTCEPPPTCPEAPTTALIKQVTCSPSATQSPCHCEPGQQSGNCEAGWTFNPWSTKCYKVLDSSSCKDRSQSFRFLTQPTSRGRMRNLRAEALKRNYHPSITTGTTPGCQVTRSNA